MSALTSALDLTALRSRRKSASTDRATARRIINSKNLIGRRKSLRVFAADTQQDHPNQGTWGDWNDLVKPGTSADAGTRVVVTPGASIESIRLRQPLS